MPGFSAMKRFEEVLDDGALDAVGVPHEAHVAGDGRGREQEGGEGGES